MQDLINFLEVLLGEKCYKKSFEQMENLYARKIENLKAGDYRDMNTNGVFRESFGKSTFHYLPQFDKLMRAKYST